MKNTTNVFSEGMVKDMHPLTTSQQQYTDALNATMITYNGNEMMMQNDMGNTRIQDTKTGNIMGLREGFIPVGMKEHGGVMYIASVDKDGNGEIGTIPSPVIRFNQGEEDFDEIEKDITIPSGFDASDLIVLNDTKIYPGEKFALALDIKLEEIEKEYKEKATEGNGSVINNKFEYVDLGLPSGTLWATYNLNQTSDNVGTLYKRDNDLDDALKKHNGSDGQWFIPSAADFKELIQNCKLTQNFNESNFVSVTLTSNINSNSITFYVSGYYSSSGYEGDKEGYYICYKESSLSETKYCYFDSMGGFTTSVPALYEGKVAVRPIIKRSDYIVKTKIYSAITTFKDEENSDNVIKYTYEKGLYRPILFSKTENQIFDLSSIVQFPYKYIIKDNTSDSDSDFISYSKNWYYETQGKMNLNNLKFHIDRMLSEDLGEPIDGTNLKSFLKYPNIPPGILCISFKKEELELVQLSKNGKNGVVYPITLLFIQKDGSFIFRIGFPELWYKTDSAVHVDRFVVNVIDQQSGEKMPLQSKNFTTDTSLEMSIGNGFIRYFDDGYYKLVKVQPGEYSSNLDPSETNSESQEMLFYMDTTYELFNKWYTLEVECYDNNLIDPVYTYNLTFNQYIYDVLGNFISSKLLSIDSVNLKYDVTHVNNSIKIPSNDISNLGLCELKYDQVGPHHLYLEMTATAGNLLNIWDSKYLYNNLSENIQTKISISDNSNVIKILESAGLFNKYNINVMLQDKYLLSSITTYSGGYLDSDIGSSPDKVFQKQSDKAAYIGYKLDNNVRGSYFGENYIFGILEKWVKNIEVDTYKWTYTDSNGSRDIYSKAWVCIYINKGKLLKLFELESDITDTISLKTGLIGFKKSINKKVTFNIFNQKTLEWLGDNESLKDWSPYEEYNPLITFDKKLVDPPNLTWTLYTTSKNIDNLGDYKIYPQYDLMGKDLLTPDSEYTKLGYSENLLSFVNINTLNNFIFNDRDNTYTLPGIETNLEDYSGSLDFDTSFNYTKYKLENANTEDSGNKISLNKGVYYLNFNFIKNNGGVKNIIKFTIEDGETLKTFNISLNNPSKILVVPDDNKWKITKVSIKRCAQVIPDSDIQMNRLLPDPSNPGHIANIDSNLYISSAGLYQIDLTYKSTPSGNANDALTKASTLEILDNLNHKYAVPQTVYTYEESNVKCLEKTYNMYLGGQHGYQEVYGTFRWKSSSTHTLPTEGNEEFSSNLILPDGLSISITYRELKLNG